MHANLLKCYSVVQICSMHPFPTKLRDPDGRERWKEAINRRDPHKPWLLLEPTVTMRVCSVHFVDSMPTAQNPDPTLQLGYETEPPLKARRLNERSESRATSDMPAEGLSTDINDQHAAPKSPPSSSFDSSFCLVVLAGVIVMLIGFIFCLQQQICLLQNELTTVKSSLKTKGKKASCKVKKTNQTGIAAKFLQNDSDVLFFTAVPTKDLFHALLNYIQKFVRRQWKGTVSSIARKRKFVNSPAQMGPQRKLSSEDAFLLTCMKLKLGLLNRDLASRFEISLALTSNIFHTWLNAMYRTIGKYVYWASKEEITASKPNRYRHRPDLRSIIDCSEIFIETPKDPLLQTSTWSDYKHHNTLKFLVAVSPNSTITFVSPAYPGRNSDTRASGFLDKVDAYDEIMADKGFLIQNDCDIRHITLSVPPGRRGSSQMTTAAVMKTKRIANIRIIVEQVIRRLKTFRILSTEMPITIVPLASKIIVVCAGLCNLRKPLYHS